ncbi:hypothetical protein BTR22_19140 [Alkalihalophilus pseudofirmus]|uniref:hypothetical protein n=1 Tax=Alkalihalophilus pseudofirmus TaxID=79885 RepID=UPI0009530838|nr:hypothetical protein BTR22_19140 [Alkalihalophilus pseudofirmus]
MNDAYVVIDASSLIQALILVWLCLVITLTIYSYSVERKKKKAVNHLIQMTERIEKIFKVPVKEAKDILKGQLEDRKSE